MMAGDVEINNSRPCPPELSLFTLNNELFKLTKPIQFAIFLKIPEHLIECIESENHRVADQKIAVFKYIADNNRSANITWASIADALDGVQAGNLAITIRKKFVTNCSSTGEPKKLSVSRSNNLPSPQPNGDNSTTMKHPPNIHGHTSYARKYRPDNHGDTSYTRDPLHTHKDMSYPRDSLPDLEVAPNSPDHAPGGCVKWKWMMAILIATAVVPSLFAYIWQGRATLIDPTDGHPITNIQELYKAAEDIPGFWEPLCENLHVQAGIISNLVSTELDPSLKMRRCLKAYYNHGDVYWEEFILVVAGSPINNKRLAKKIAKTHGINFNLLMKKEEL